MKHFIKSYVDDYRYLFKGTTEYRLYKSPVKSAKYVLYIREYDYDMGIYRFISQGLFNSIKEAEDKIR